MAIRLYWHGIFQLIGDGISTTITFDLRDVVAQTDFEGSKLPNNKPDHLYSVIASGPNADPQTGVVPIVSAELNGWKLFIEFAIAPPVFENNSNMQISVILGYNG